MSLFFCKIFGSGQSQFFNFFKIIQVVVVLIEIVLGDDPLKLVEYPRVKRPIRVGLKPE